MDDAHHSRAGKLTIEQCENGYLITGAKPNGNPRSADAFSVEVKMLFTDLEAALEYLRSSI